MKHVLSGKRKCLLDFEFCKFLCQAKSIALKYGILLKFALLNGTPTVCVFDRYYFIFE